MFLYFWEEMGYIWKEDTFDNLFKLMVKKDLPDYLSLVFQSRTLHTIFEAMSYQYKFSFVENIIKNWKDSIEEIN